MKKEMKSRNNGKEASIKEGFWKLYKIISTLRGPDGCPWDRLQTKETLRMYLLEEAYEVLDAIERQDVNELCKELGDLLFHIVFISKVSEEDNEFTLEEVLKNISEKMIRRHPHVFGNKKVDGPEEVIENWYKIKRKEEGKKDPFSGIPSSLPALLWAHRIAERGKSAGIFDMDVKETMEHIRKDLSTLNGLILKKERDHEKISELIGRLLFYLSFLSKALGLNSESILREMNRKVAFQIQKGFNTKH